MDRRSACQPHVPERGETNREVCMLRGVGAFTPRMLARQVVASYFDSALRIPSPMEGWRNGKEFFCSTPGRARMLARIVSCAIPPGRQRRAKDGTGRIVGRRSARPSARVNSTLVTGFGDTIFAGP